MALHWIFFTVGLLFVVPVLGSLILPIPEVGPLGDPEPSLSVLYKERQGRRLVEAIYAQNKMVDCYIMADQQVSEEFLTNLPPDRTLVLESSEMQEVLDECSALLLDHLLSGNLHAFTQRNLTRGANTRGIFDALLIFPGTKWCGAGHIAADYSDLGLAAETDSCCRDHDHCEDSIPAGQQKYGLKNKAIHTKSHCTCDQQFERCLKSNAAVVSDSVGCLYFNLLQAQCFENSHPIKKCVKHSGLIPWIYWSCQKYEFDTSKPKVWQFLDAKKY